MHNSSQTHINNKQSETDHLDRLFFHVNETVNCFLSIDMIDKNGQEILFNKFVKLMTLIDTCSNSGIRREYIIKTIEPINMIFNTYLCQRARTWPRGYQGDFETIDYLYHKTNNYQHGSSQWFIENFIHSLDITQQHRNKVIHQANRIKHCIHENEDAHIAILACGGCIDLGLIQDDIVNSNAIIYINDQDKDAITASLNRCHQIKDKLHPLHMDIIHAIKNISREKNLDLVVAGGVFDYLNDRLATMVIKNTVKTLNHHGKFIFTNIYSQNPFKSVMEHIFNWELIHRSENDIVELCQQSEIGDASVTVTRDETGLALLVEVIKK